jgi:hypothetical protein
LVLVGLLLVVGVLVVVVGNLHCRWLLVALVVGVVVMVVMVCGGVWW